MGYSLILAIGIYPALHLSIPALVGDLISQSDILGQDLALVDTSGQKLGGVAILQGEHLRSASQPQIKQMSLLIIFHQAIEYYHPIIVVHGFVIKRFQVTQGNHGAVYLVTHLLGICGQECLRCLTTGGDQLSQLIQGHGEGLLGRQNGLMIAFTE